MSAEEAHVLHAKVREKIGSRYCRRVREAGGLPAVIYGHKIDPVPITLSAHEAVIAIERGEKVFRLEVEGQEAENVLLKDLHFDYLGTNIVHADFARVDLDERVKVHAHVEFVGEAPGLKKAGAVLDHPVTELEIECAVFNIPDKIEVDISALDVGHPIHAGEVTLPKPTMKLLTDPDAVVARVEVRHVEEDTTGEAADISEGAS